MAGTGRRGGNDPTLDTLLELDGVIAEIGGGYWVKIVAKPDPDKPHGIGYALTLHDPTGNRVLGYDNAHPVRTRRGPSARSTRAADHRHRGRSVRAYDYVDAGKLMEDFWTDVEAVLKAEGIA